MIKGVWLYARRFFVCKKNATNSVKILDNTPQIAYNIIKDKEQNKRRKSK